MADPDLDTADSLEDPVLAGMLRDQLLILGGAGPEQLVALVGDPMVFCLVTWDLTPGAGAIEAAEGRLREIVVVRLGRAVESFGASVSGDRRRALLSFVLGNVTEELGGPGEGLVAWARQTRRGARGHRAEACRLRLATGELRAQSRGARALR